MTVTQLRQGGNNVPLLQHVAHQSKHS